MKLTPLLITARWLAYLTVPHFVFVYFHQSSVGIGLLFVAAGLLVFYAAKGRLAITRLQLTALFVIFASIVYSCLHFDASAITRQSVSFISIGLVCVATNGLFRDVVLRSPAVTRVVIRYTFYILVCIGITGKLRLFAPGIYADYPKPIFPFAEESHFALTLGVVACAYMMLVRPKFRLGVPLALLGFAAWFPNTTMLCAALLLIAVLFSFRTIFIFMMLAATVLFAPARWLTAIDVDYFTQRIKVGENAENLTTVIYFQGWEQAWIATWEGRGMGVGFQRFGSEPPGSRAQYVDAVYGLDLNRQDGSNVGSKLLGEFGLIGMMALGAAACAGVWAFRGLRRLRGREASSSVHILHLSVVYMFIIELFFRGLGYLNPIIFLYLYCVPRLGMTRYITHVLGRLSASTR